MGIRETILGLEKNNPIVREILRLYRNRPFFMKRHILDDLLYSANFHAPSWWDMPYDEKSMVSIIILANDKSGTIEEAIRSAHNQTYRNVEIIVIENGSNDDTREKIKALEKVIPMSAFYFDERLGLDGGKNFGLDNAHGDYILVLDGDDLIDPDFLRKTVKYLDDDPSLGIIYTDLWIIDSKENKKNMIFPGPFNRHRFMDLGRSEIVNTSLYRREFVERFGLRYVRISDSTTGYTVIANDYNMWRNIIQCGETADCGGKPFYIPHPLFSYRIDKNQSREMNHLLSPDNDHLMNIAAKDFFGKTHYRNMLT